MERIRVASLFCGCGGMDLGVIGGFEYLGLKYKEHPMDIVYSVDFDEYCSAIYNDNFSHKCEVKDVRNIEIEKLPQFDMLIGGFPCQSFSISAQNPPRLGYKDERGMLFFEMVKILRERKPRLFIAENVKGLLSANKGQAFPMIIKEFKDAGYNVAYKLLNAADYGVPQKRERVIIVGFKDAQDYVNFCYPSKVKHEARRVLGDVIIESNNHDEKLFFSEKAVSGMMAVREKMNKGRAMNPLEPCNTISAHLAKVSLNSTDPVLMIDGRYRRFSPREAARIQSFPDNFKLDCVSHIRQYKAIGNAVPPVMMWHVTEAIIATLQKDNVQELTSSASRHKAIVYKQLNLFDALEHYPDCIVTNTVEEFSIKFNSCGSKPDVFNKNVLISLVKKDNLEQYEDRSAKVYYTGHKFPASVALNKLYYFMPYIKGKGVRDLYLIKVARVGTRKEGQRGEDPKASRLLFEIEFVKQLFDKYKLVPLKIWRTFNDTTLAELVK